jgi:hypothetical protein
MSLNQSLLHFYEFDSCKGTELGDPLVRRNHRQNMQIKRTFALVDQKQENLQRSYSFYYTDKLKILRYLGHYIVFVTYESAQ